MVVHLYYREIYLTQEQIQYMTIICHIIFKWCIFIYFFYFVDYVRKRFPGATRSEIVLQINMKCKEARVILSKRESEVPKKSSVSLIMILNVLIISLNREFFFYSYFNNMEFLNVCAKNMHISLKINYYELILYDKWNEYDKIGLFHVNLTRPCNPPTRI